VDCGLVLLVVALLSSAGPVWFDCNFKLFALSTFSFPLGDVFFFLGFLAKYLYFLPLFFFVLRGPGPPPTLSVTP